MSVSSYKKSVFRQSKPVDLYNGRPLFVPGWWSSLHLNQKFLIIVYLLIFCIGFIILLFLLLNDAYIKHQLIFIGVARNNKSNEQITYNLSVKICVFN